MGTILKIPMALPKSFPFFMSKPHTESQFHFGKKKKMDFKFHDSPTKSSGLKILIRSLIEWAIMLFLLIHRLDLDTYEPLTLWFNAKWVPPYLKVRAFWELHFCMPLRLNALGIVSALDRCYWISFVSCEKKKKNFFFWLRARSCHSLYWTCLNLSANLW